MHRPSAVRVPLRPALAPVALAFVALAAGGLAGCRRDGADAPLTAGEASEALEEARASRDAEALTSSTVELATTFTLGQGVERAADELRAFVATQLPCADVRAERAKLTVAYGAKGGSCTSRGRSFSGTHAIEVARADEGAVEVKHAWTDLSNGLVSVTGTATVTWAGGPSGGVGSRTVVHALTWRHADGRTVEGTGRREQTPLGGAWADGVVVTGERAWTSERGAWELGLEGVEARWQDPVPQAGTYALTTPAGKELTLTFARVDDDTIRVEVGGGRRTFSFRVARAGGASEPEASEADAP